MANSNSLTRLAAACALALLACGGALAQGSVQIYGQFDLSVGRSQLSGTTATDGVDSGKLTTSFLGIRGSEALGGGINAIFALEHFVRLDTGSAGRNDTDPFWARGANVGLSGKFGTLTLGRNTQSLWVQTLSFNALGNSTGLSPSARHYFINGTVTGDTAWRDSIRYVSPRFGGVNFTLQSAAGEGNGGGNSGASVNYAAGPLAAGLAWQKVKKGTTVQDTTASQLAASYDFKSVKVFAQLGKVDNDTTNVSFDITGVGAAVPLGAGKVLLQWSNINPSAGSKRTTTTFGYDHNMSKRTNVYLLLMSDRISGRSTGNSSSLGIRHSF